MSSLRLVPDAPGHDLPPRWDGLVISWQGWKPGNHVFVCTEPTNVCDHCGRGEHDTDMGCSCGSVRPPSSNVGFVADDPATTLDELERNIAGSDLAHRTGRPKSAPERLGLIRLVAHRCPDCDADTVVDTATGEVWTLDESDYGDAGSESPASEGGA